MKKRFLAGFSLLEVSISLLIIGLVSSISISQLHSIAKFNNAQKTRTNIDCVIKALEAYYIFYESLPEPYEVGADGFGKVPFEKLGIMEKFAKDGNGKWLLYKLDFQITENAIENFNDKKLFFIKGGDIEEWRGARLFLHNCGQLIPKNARDLPKKILKK